MKKELENKLYDWKDWIPICGWYNLMKKVEKAPEEIIREKKFQAYIFLNSIYFSSCFYSMFYEIMKNFSNK
ncbi:MAG: hypothetical protein QW117_02220 [Candidatus Pacearchaeota archaeon]